MKTFLHATPIELLRKDLRLKEKVAVTYRTNTYGYILRELSRTSGAKFGLSSNAREFEKFGILALCKEAPIYALMDAVSSQALTVWEKQDKDTYLLMPSNRSRDEVFGAKTEERRRRNELGLSFVASAQRLPLEQQARLYSPSGMRFSDLPKGMQQFLRDFIENHNREYAGIFMPKDPGNLPFSTIRLSRKRIEDFNDYKVAINGRNLGGMWSVTDYDEVKRKKDADARTGDFGNRYSPEKNEITQKQARRLPALQKSVEAHARDATFPDILKQLHDRYNIALVSETHDAIRQRAKVDLGPMPFWQALDRLTEIYADTEWEYRKYGFLIVRGPNNPARDPSKGSSYSISGTGPRQ